MTSSLSKYEGKLPSPFNFFIQGHFRSILLDGQNTGYLDVWKGCQFSIAVKPIEAGVKTASYNCKEKVVIDWQNIDTCILRYMDMILCVL